MVPSGNSNGPTTIRLWWRISYINADSTERVLRSPKYRSLCLDVPRDPQSHWSDQLHLLFPQGRRSRINQSGYLITRIGWVTSYYTINKKIDLCISWFCIWSYFMWGPPHTKDVKGECIDWKKDVLYQVYLLKSLLQLIPSTDAALVRAPVMGLWCNYWHLESTDEAVALS